MRVRGRGERERPRDRGHDRQPGASRERAPPPGRAARSHRARRRSHRRRARRSRGSSSSHRRGRISPRSSATACRTTQDRSSRRPSRRSRSGGRRTCTSWRLPWLARNENAASSPVGTLPPDQVTFVITAFSPEPVCWTVRCQPGEGTNESMLNPDGRRELDLRRRRPVLLGRDGERVHLAFALQPEGWADTRVSERRRRKNEGESGSKYERLHGTRSPVHGLTVSVNGAVITRPFTRH